VKKTRASWVRALAIIVIFVGAAAGVFSQRSSIGEGLHNIGSLNWVRVLAASLIEVLSMLALALLYRALLEASRARLTVTRILLRRRVLGRVVRRIGDYWGFSWAKSSADADSARRSGRRFRGNIPRNCVGDSRRSSSSRDEIPRIPGRAESRRVCAVGPGGTVSA
jgi:hypothetical protein